MNPMNWPWLLVALGGGVGSLVRYVVAVQTRTWWGEGFPWGTLFVNVVGCLLIGLLAELVGEREVLRPELKFALIVGFLGGFTTFSSFGLETVELLQLGRTTAASLYVLGSNILGLLAVVAGWYLARLWATA